MSLRPKESIPVDIFFAPQYRVAPFKLGLQAMCNLGQQVHLVNISGVCHATEIKLSEQSLLFGAVVLGSTATKKLHLHNFGDLGAKYGFEIPAKYRDIVTVAPASGFVSPHDDVLLSVSLHPSRVSKGDLAIDNIRCVLDNHEPIKLMVTGRCIEQPKENETTLTFAAEVRQEQVQNFKLPPPPIGKNPTAYEWRLRPVVTTKIPEDGQFFFCKEEVVVPAGGDANLEIVYRPLATTRQAGDEQPPAEGEAPKGKKYKPEKHEGSVFVATPDGQAFVIKLEGTATPAGVNALALKEVDCKSTNITQIPIQNWMHVRQRFTVKVELTDPAPDSDAAKAIKVYGVDTFDLPPDLERSYSINMYAYKEGAATVRITFTNDRTGDTLIKEQPFKFIAAKSLATIKLDAACRQKQTEHIIIANPLDVKATFQCTSTYADIKFDPQPFEVAPNSEGTLALVFRPVLEGSGEAQITLVSPELGTYPYQVEYVARAAGLDKTVMLKVPLGSEAVETYRFMHCASKPATYTGAVEAAPGTKLHADTFVIDTKDIKAAGAGAEGEMVPVDIRYVPSALGESRAMLKISSPDGGIFSALLVGHCIPPQPQGPIVTPAGKATNVDFKNPFEVATEFTIQIDNPQFTVANKVQKIDPRKAVAVPVTFKGDKEQGARLTISCLGLPTPWIFFLKGTK